MKFIYTLSAISLLCILQACKKTETPLVNATSVDTAGVENVFICGIEEVNGLTRVALWNKRNNKILEQGIAQAIAVDENSVAIVYYHSINSIDHLYVWKDGVISEIASVNATTETRPVDIELSGGIVYIAGVEYDGSIQSACFWVNGQRNALPDSGFNSEVNALFVDGSDVYVAGSVTSFSNKKYPCFWKNGQLNILPRSNKGSAEANDIYLSGSDIFVVGRGYEGYGYLPLVWKNSVLDSLKHNANNCNPISICISGSDEYILADDNNELVVWKNRIPSPLPDSKITSGFLAPRKVIVKDGKVYVLSIHDYDNIAYNYLWIDGQKQLIKKGEWTISWSLAVR